MKDEYKKWIQKYEADAGFLLGECKKAVDAMVKEFPELKAVPGHVVCPAPWGKRAHWWAVTETGEIVDPTVTQFPRVIAYLPWEPGDEVRVGKCMDCGNEIWAVVETLSSPPPRRTFCNQACEDATIAYLTAR